MVASGFGEHGLSLAQLACQNRRMGLAHTGVLPTPPAVGQKFVENDHGPAQRIERLQNSQSGAEIGVGAIRFAEYRRQLVRESPAVVRAEPHAGMERRRY